MFDSGSTAALVTHRFASKAGLTGSMVSFWLIVVGHELEWLLMARLEPSLQACLDKCVERVEVVVEHVMPVVTGQCARGVQRRLRVPDRLGPLGRWGKTPTCLCRVAPSVPIVASQRAWLEQPAARTSLLTRSRSILLISRQSSFPWGFWKVNGAAAGTGVF